jgi:hypothetical protein
MIESGNKLIINKMAEKETKNKGPQEGAGKKKQSEKDAKYNDRGNSKVAIEWVRKRINEMVVG